MSIGSLCSGYGGLDLAVESVFPGSSTAWFCEYDRDPSTILAHHWPDVPNHGDVWHTDWAAVEPVDILTAGYPCQPFSHAGKRKGANDPRHLWPDVARAVGALRPGLVVLENVAGHVSLGLADVLGDLSALGYDATWGVVRAADAGAPHGRARIGTTNTYRRYGCRCAECVEANSRYFRERRSRLGERARPTPPDDGIVDWVVVERLLRREAPWTAATVSERKAAAARAFAAQWEDAYVFASEYLRLRSEAIKAIRADLDAWLALPA